VVRRKQYWSEYENDKDRSINLKVEAGCVPRVVYCLDSGWFLVEEAVKTW